MVDMIRDGIGRGYMMEVDAENMAHVKAITETAERHANEEHGLAFHVLFDQSATGAADCFFYAKNNSDDDMMVEGVWFSAASAEAVFVRLNDTGAPSGGTTPIPTNCKGGSGNEADGTFMVGNNITGVSGGDIVEKFWLTSAESKYFNFEQDIIIPKNGVFTLLSTTGGVNVRGTVVFNYHK